MRLRSAGGSASSTGFIRKPKMGRANASPATPSTSTAMTTRSRRERSSPRCSARLIRAWSGSLLSHAGGLALRACAGPPARLRQAAAGSVDAGAEPARVAPGPSGAAEDGRAATTPSGGGKTEG